MNAGPAEAEPPAPDASPPPKNVILVGYRGSGKTIVGRLLAQRLAWEFVDTDEQIESAAGQSIAAIFAGAGEAEFRELEGQALKRAVAGSRRVISVGGGAVLSAQNRELIRAAGVCIWLTAPPEELHRRCQADPDSAAHRPVLTAAPGLDEIRQVLAFRRPLYQAVADHVVDTTGRPAADVARAVVEIVSGKA
jgi:shikimate kinase